MYRVVNENYFGIPAGEASAPEIPPPVITRTMKIREAPARTPALSRNRPVLMPLRGNRLSCLCMGSGGLMGTAGIQGKRMPKRSVGPPMRPKWPWDAQKRCFSGTDPVFIQQRPVGGLHANGPKLHARGVSTKTAPVGRRSQGLPGAKQRLSTGRTRRVVALSGDRLCIRTMVPRQ